MQLYLYGKEGRHVVVSREEVGEKATEAFWVALNPEVDGSARRGRPPGTATSENGVRRLSVSTSQVTQYTDPSDKIVELATKVLEAEAAESMDIQAAA